MNTVLAKRVSAKSIDIAAIDFIMNILDYKLHLFKYSTIAFIGFFIIYETILIYSGQNSLGKHLFKIKVISNNKAQIGFIRSLVRTIISLISIYFFSIGFFSALRNKESKTFYDNLTKTNVIDLDPTPS